MMRLRRLASTGLANDRLVGGGILAGSLAGMVTNGLALVNAWQITLIVTAFPGVALLLGNSILTRLGRAMKASDIAKYAETRLLPLNVLNSRHVFTRPV